MRLHSLHVFIYDLCVFTSFLPKIHILVTSYFFLISYSDSNAKKTEKILCFKRL